MERKTITNYKKNLLSGKDAQVLVQNVMLREQY